ncbi:anthranilate phosphoribosyltransferase [Congregibacter brevis]|uniref:Anthranilate phosphoribosyltransferase n=1 Tax=Congregibacter brevis TaxID=3081201 RepID=A0ABZ0IBL5_9GAMM|nr:anthranilate phosphoribosyltransferase [Congregibacter sp. IMCC45268]
MDIQQALGRVVEQKDLSREEMAAVMRQIMSGDATDAQIGGLLMGLRMKGETIDEIAAAAAVMRDLATPVAVQGDNLVDLVGTGGDGANLFNVSTASCFVVAAAGAQVAKHGNRSVSSTSGSSDVLETLGVPLDLDPEQVARAIEDVGLGFMFAPAHHSAMRYAIGPRRELGLRTLFNLLGPLTNPAQVKRQLLGVYDEDLCEPLAHALKALGSEHAMVVHAQDGLDEISIAAPTNVAELRDGEIRSYIINPADFGLGATDLSGLSVDSAQGSAALIRAALSGRGGDSDTTDPEKARQIIAMNAGATIYVSGIAASLADGVALAEDLLSTGQAFEKLKAFVDLTQIMREEKNA